MPTVVEVKHESINYSKTFITRVLEKGYISVPSYVPDVVNGRWRAVHTGDFHTLHGDDEKMVDAMLHAISASTRITTQRNIYYTVRGAHPDWTYKGKDMKEDAVYEALVGHAENH